MEVKTERTIAYGLAAVLLVVGIICYAAFAQKTPEQPVRIMFKNTGGNVLFDHKEHLSESGYGFACDDCHHDIEQEGDKPASCGECHTAGGDIPKRSDVLHTQCKGCHDESGGPVDCAECHAM
jgi:hypothetical protein